MNRIIFFSFLIFITTNLYSQNNSNVDFFYQKADSLWKIAEYDSSNFYFLKASEIYKNDSAWSKVVDCYINIGINKRYLGKFESALNYLNNATSIVKNKFSDKDSILVTIYNSIGTIYYDKGNYQKAFELYNKTLKLSLKRFGKDNINTGKGYHNTGLIYYRWNDAEKAMDYFQKALSIWLNTLGPEHSFIANCYTNIANIYYLKGSIEQAIKYDEKALGIWEKRLGKNHPFVAYSYTNLSSSYQYLGKYDKALDLIRKSIAIKQKLGKESPELAEDYINIGRIFTNMNQIDSAQYYLNKSIQIQRETKNKNHLVIAAYYLRQAELSASQKKFTEAINCLDSSLILTYPKILNTNSPAKLNYSEVPREEVFISSIIKRADIYYLRYLDNAKNLNDLINSLLNYQTASKYFEYSRGEFFRNESKLLLGKKASEVNNKGIETSLKLFESTHEQKYKEIAFNFAERNKARVLFEAINEADAKKYSNIPDSLLELEKDIKSKLVFFETRLQNAKEENDSSYIIENQNEIFDLKERYDNLKNLFETNYPEYHELKYNKPIVKISKLQSILGSKDALLEYYIIENSLFIFIIKYNRFYLIKTKLNGQLSKKISSLRRSLSNLEFSKYFNTSFLLYNNLIRPVEKFIKDISKLYIIPDGILNYLPFEILLTKNIQTNNPDFSKLPYLINKYEITYQFSASLLNEMNLHSRESRKGKFIGIAPVFDNKNNEENRISTLIDSTLTYSNIKRAININGNKFSALPESQNEITAITKMFTNKNRSAEYYLRNDAKEDLLKSNNIKNFGFIHLATHGFINEEKPKLSGILFTKEENPEDGILYSNEIYNLNLNADLVVLSACESGLGKVVKGEGIMGLTRGFLYSGANNVTVSLWQVGDKSTSKLMIYFYNNILNGLSYSRSLRNAKLKIISEKKYAYPLEWGPFILIGNIE